MVFELRDVSYGYGAGDVLRAVQLQIPARTTVLVSGPNGSGKTTLFKLLSGVLNPSQGRIVRWVSWEEMVSLGHETALYPGLTVVENLRFWTRMYRSPKPERELLDGLARVGLEAVAYEPASHLSRGMAQRLSLARVLALSPKVLLLDEPMTGLDGPSQDMIRREVVRARERGATVLLITHSPDTDIQSADYRLELGGGKATMRAWA
jgi:heme exporter protein A